MGAKMAYRGKRENFKTMHDPITCFQNIGDTELEYLLYKGSEPTIVPLHATGIISLRYVL
jgi:hypothetical protein